MMEEKSLHNAGAEEQHKGSNNLPNNQMSSTENLEDVFDKLRNDEGLFAPESYPLRSIVSQKPNEDELASPPQDEDEARDSKGTPYSSGENSQAIGVLAPPEESGEESHAVNNPQFDFTHIDNPEDNPNIGLFTVKSANQVIDEAKNRPTPSKLFGQLWWEHDVCILFSDSNLGKTILAYQIADAISCGKNAINGLENEAQPQIVLYFDFELSDKQFEERFKDDVSGMHYKFSPNLMRVEINPDADDYPDDGDFEGRLKQDIIDCIEQTNAKVIVIDNITYMNPDNEKAKNAIPLMQWIKKVGRKYNLSILVLAHTPKRNTSNPLTKNDLAGSRNLYNFCDGCFAIGESSKDNSIRYIKELKQRHTYYKYDSNNVVVCEIVKRDNFTQFYLIGYGFESEHLRQINDTDREELIERAKELSLQGKSQREIAHELGISPATVNNYLKK